jgi:pimeloyl-ACP methyl ester carboxylesterase
MGLPKQKGVVTMSYCKVEKANIYYEEIGSGTPILMIHGFSPDHRLMKGCMEPIFQKMDGYRRIYIDLPGMGQTKDYESIQNFDEMLETVIQFIDTTLPEQSLLIAGESYGGYITRGIIAKMPEMVMGAAFICPMIIPDKNERTLPEHANIQVDQEFLTTLKEVEREDFKGIHVKLDEYTWKRYNEEVVAGMKIADSAFLEKISGAYGFTFKIDHEVFSKPSVFLAGRQDHITGYKDVFDILDKYPRATFSVLDTAGHNLQIEQAELLKVHIGEWLDRFHSFVKDVSGMQVLKDNITLPDNIRGRSIHSNIIPTVCNVKNMIEKLLKVNGDYSELKQWEKRSYQAYKIDKIQDKLLSSPLLNRIELLKSHILILHPKDLGASCIDIYLVAYVAETYGKGKKTFFKYIRDVGISDKENTAQAIWQVGKGDGFYLGVLHDDGSIKDWNFFAKWIKGIR